MARWLIDMAGVQVTVVARDESSEALVSLALAAIPTETIGSSLGIKLSLKHDDGKWDLKDHSNKLERRLEHTGDVIYHLTDRIVFHIADKSQDVHCLHAASVASNGRAIVIPANSGAGKSSFTTWLAANGFDYLTDELILVDKDACLQGVARPIQMKFHGLKAVESLISEPSLIQKGKFATALPIACLGGVVAQDRQKLAMFIFPKYEKNKEYSLRKLSSAEAGMRLMANHVNARNLEGHGFRAMMEIIRNTPSYALDYGGFKTLPSDFSEQLLSSLRG